MSERKEPLRLAMAAVAAYLRGDDDGQVELLFPAANDPAELRQLVFALTFLNASILRAWVEQDGMGVDPVELLQRLILDVLDREDEGGEAR